MSEQHPYDVEALSEINSHKDSFEFSTIQSEHANREILPGSSIEDTWATFLSIAPNGDLVRQASSFDPVPEDYDEMRKSYLKQYRVSVNPWREKIARLQQITPGLGNIMQFALIDCVHEMKKYNLRLLGGFIIGRSIDRANIAASTFSTKLLMASFEKMIGDEAGGMLENNIYYSVAMGTVVLNLPEPSVVSKAMPRQNPDGTIPAILP